MICQCDYIIYRLCDLKDLQKAGLFINDLNSFDMSRDMVMAGWQHASQLERSIEEVIETIKTNIQYYT